MKIKKFRREMRDAIKDMVRPIFTRLCALPFKTRAILAWQLLRADDDLDKANRRTGGTT